MKIGPIERGVGCLSVFPAGFFGLAGLTDGAGPRGWRGISEFVGWGAICVIAGLSLGLLLNQWRRKDSRRYVAVPLAILALVAFTYAPYWLGLHAPWFIKVVFTSLLQVIGSMASVGVVAFFAFILWTGRRQS